MESRLRDLLNVKTSSPLMELINSKIYEDLEKVEFYNNNNYVVI